MRNIWASSLSCQGDINSAGSYINRVVDYSVVRISARESTSGFYEWCFCLQSNPKTFQFLLSIGFECSFLFGFFVAYTAILQGSRHRLHVTLRVLLLLPKQPQGYQASRSDRLGAFLSSWLSVESSTTFQDSHHFLHDSDVHWDALLAR